MLEDVERIGIYAADVDRGKGERRKRRECTNLGRPSYL